ncbi:hypothetical protein ABT147_05665 [Streptomyces sp. NPDC001868]|uniref:hypothetical protein n=1 Tax=Streptomyces sp. NPDC001868 TaxID=3154401 RepID=UPI0033213318
MTSAAALPGAGAVLRVVRGAAGRRPVRIALLVGGLFVLGVLCGQRASAADRVPASPPLPVAVTAAVTEVTGAVGDVVPSAGKHAVEPVTRRVVERPVTEHVVRPVAEHVVRPVVEDLVEPVADPVSEHVVAPVVEDVVRPVTDPVLAPVVEGVVVPVGDLVESVSEGLAGMPSQLPPVSGLPSLPGLPEVPELPGWTTLPVETGPVEVPPVNVTPQAPGRAGAESPGSDVDGDSGSDGERAAGRTAVAYGPNAMAGGAVVAVTAPHRDAAAGHTPAVRTPARQNPDGLPTGTLRRHSAVDNGGPRHAEPYAVTSPDPAPLSLVPGAPAADAADGTRDRHRDIPESPG